MYICGDTNTVAQMEPDTAGYVPNNPLFGLPLESPQECPTDCGGCQNCQGTTSLSLSGLHGSDFDCGNCLDHNNILSLSQGNTQATNINNGYWSEDMSSFPGLPPLELDPLPSLFPFSPCGASYNRTERMQPNHEGHVADVLLSLKHAVLKPNSEAPQMPTHQQTSSYPSDGYSKITPQASVSYIASVHPQMHLLSPSNYNTMTSQAQNPYPSSSYYDNCVQHPPPAMYPSSLSVNVSMTMHGCGGAVDTPILPMQCSHSQMQWNPQNSGSSVNVQNVLYPPLLSPGTYSGGATYSFTADFRPQSSTQNNVPLLEPMKFSPPSPQKQFFQISSKHFNQSPVDPNLTYTTPQKSPNYGQVKIKDAKSLGINYENDDDSSDDLGGDNKPNLCRLCGKTYARPSTLKTHLRTHSGERPYRCNSCNKSFSQAANLTAHLRTHTGQKPFRCQICDRRFSQSSSVTTHMRTHSGERPYRCRACKKAFSDSSTLTKHLRIHSGEKPYQCKICSLRFSQSGNLNRHMRVHGTNGALIT